MNLHFNNYAALQVLPLEALVRCESTDSRLPVHGTLPLKIHWGWLPVWIKTGVHRR